MKPFFCRVGNKRKLLNFIKPYIPIHDTYIEPFFGSGALFFGLNEMVNNSIINDLDDDVYNGIILLKNADENIDNYEICYTIETTQALVNKTTTDKNEQLLQYLYLSSCTFGNRGVGKIYRTRNGLQKIKHIQFYKKRLENTIILKQDYKQIINDYDHKNAFFFLDPPYEKSGDLYKNPNIDYEEMNNILINMKGKFLLTINDSETIRNIFSHFYIVEIHVKGQGNGNSALGGLFRKELFIMNYIL